ncbi:inorganic phosphate transporter (plasmid) [Paracoccus sp. TK19116]|uniref:Phosphate transporter n=1 Tax=Paracoccus albicereus TaxID=2922394 RepID=A0ABT1MNX3_9RHOB|nr:inorganic phosphate transporter [Paracoccus albicereus]MCQ0969261.1 inorganic phosphate transporter [Paracoccus albicereus]
MARRSTPEYRILDKDLARVSDMESAHRHAARPVLGLGAIVVLCAALAILAVGIVAGLHGPVILAAGLALAAYLALSIGANDASNALAPAFGAGSVGLGAGLALIGVAQLAGALLAGHSVTERLATGIVGPVPLAGDQRTALAMLAALLGAGAWISFATWRRLPVSTTHSVVGSIAGAGLVVHGAGAVAWQSLAYITAIWVCAPVISGCIAALLLAFLRHTVGNAKDRISAGLIWLPAMIAAMGASFAIYLLDLILAVPGPLIWTVTPMTAGLSWWWTRRRLERDIARQAEPRPALKRLLAGPLLVAAVLLAFAHGSNDVANVAGPLSVIVERSAFDSPDMSLERSALLLAAGGIALGSVIFGRALVRTVGGGITRLNAARALCITLATTATVLTASWVGLPVSTTHIAVGGVFGVGFFREWDDRRRRRDGRAEFPVEERLRRRLVRRSHVVSILAAWLVTIPVTAGLAALCCFAILTLASG